MSAIILWAWDATNEVYRKVVCNEAGKLIIDPSEIFEDVPTDGETGKAPTSNWAYDHKEDAGAHHNQAHTLASHSTKAHSELSDAPESAHHTKFTTTEHTAIGDSAPHHAKYTDNEAKAAAVQAGAITDGVTKAPTHDAVYDVKQTADAAATDPHGAAQHIDGGFLDKFREFVSWLSLDGCTVGGDTDYEVNSRVNSIDLLTGATTDYDSYMATIGYWTGFADTGGLAIIEFAILYLRRVTYQNIWMRLAYGGFEDPPSETEDHFGWKIINGDLYATNADGATQTITDTGVDLAAGAQNTRLKMVLDPGVDIKFYVNGVLKVTHTTNLPDAILFRFHAFLRTLTTDIRRIYFGRLFVEKEYA